MQQCEKNKLTSSDLVNCQIPEVKVYLRAEPIVLDPYQNGAAFRGEESFDGTFSGWKRWQKPSPEPPMETELLNLILQEIQMQQGRTCQLHDLLLQQISSRVNLNQPMVLVSILRAGVFIALGLAARMVFQGYPKPAIAALGLFHEAGFDEHAFAQILQDFSGHSPVFVDGWTGRGVVARELRTAYSLWRNQTNNMELPASPLLATLVDPGHYGDCWGTDQDTLVPCAYFTAPQVLGFSRAFINDPGIMWSAYTYPVHYLEPRLMAQWLQVFNQKVETPAEQERSPQDLELLLKKLACLDPDPLPIGGEIKNKWKVNANEIVRSFINREPRHLFMGLNLEEIQKSFPALLYLAQKKRVPIHCHPELSKNHNCLAAVKL